VEPLSADEIRRSFVNSSKSRIKAMSLPSRFTELPWESLDYLGWRDPKAPNRRRCGRSGSRRVLKVS